TALPGAVFGGALGLYLYCRAARLSKGKMLDAAAPGAALAIGLGRLAASFTGENMGPVVYDPGQCRFPLAVYVEDDRTWRAPLFFYGSALALAVMAVLLLLIAKKTKDKLFRPQNGDIFLMFLILYFVPQGVFELLRYDKLFWNVLRISFLSRLQTLSVSASVGMIAAAASIAIFLIRRIRREGIRPRTIWQIPACALFCLLYFHGVLRMTLPIPLTEYQIVWIGAAGLIFVGLHTFIQTSVRPIPAEIDSNEPLRVLHVVGRMDRGGIETMIMNIYRAIDRDKVQFDFLAHYGKEDADYNAEIKSLGGRIYEAPVIKSITESGAATHYHKFFAYRRALRRFFLEHQEYDVIHGHMTNTAAIYMPLAKRYGGASCLIAHSHSVKAVRGLQKLASDILHLPVRYLATDFFACSDSASGWLFRETDEVTIIRNGVDTGKFAYNKKVRDEVRREENLSGLIIGEVARFQYPKNQIFLLDMLKSLLEKRRDVTLCLVGDGPEREAFEQKAEAMGLSNHIRLMGLRSDVDRIEQAFDLFVMPSIYEGQPVSLIEAQCAGLPCLVSDGVSDTSDISGKTRFLPLSAGGGGWAEAVLSLAEIPRTDGSLTVRGAGYDCATTAEFLREFYLSKRKQTQST
ncbi:MAG: glycosyltransferase, partial [Oscillospiraceae bacterium]|nr:glycosyltransferase [Oscillospiraceae bacterium]